MFVISGVSESMELECRAENRLGKISKKLYIYVYDLQGKWNIDNNPEKYLKFLL